MDTVKEPSEEVVDAACLSFKDMPYDVFEKMLVWIRFIRDVGCYTENKTIALVAQNIDFHTNIAPCVHVPMPSGEARRTFRMIPRSKCKYMVRRWCEELQQEGESVEDAMWTALNRSFDLFEHVWWVMLRGTEEGPWNRTDVIIALASARVAVQLSLPQVKNTVMVSEHGIARLEALASVDPALLEKTPSACFFVECALMETCSQMRAAATAIFYHAANHNGAHVPRIALAKRLEAAVPKKAKEFIVSWCRERRHFRIMKGECMESIFETEKGLLSSQGLAEHEGKPWYQQAQVGPYNLIVRYYLFGTEPHVEEPVGTTLSGESHLCATQVYAWCTRLDLASEKTKKRLLQAVSISARCKCLQASGGTCLTCSASNAKVCAPVHCMPPVITERPPGGDRQTDMAREVELDKEEARNTKLITTRLAVQPSLVGPKRARQLALDALLFLSAQGDLLRGEAELLRADTIRKEQEAIADRWNHESLERGPLKRSKSKKKKKEAKATAEEVEKHVISCSVRSRLVGVLRAYDRKVLKARHFHKAFNYFCRSGLLEKYKDPQNKVGEGGRFKTLHASGESSIKMLCSLSRDIKKHEVDRFV